MKTIFDWLTMPKFRERTGMFIGRRDLVTLNTWMNGYWSACEDVGEFERIRTAHGVPIDLLRDYIALKEGYESTGGIPHTLQETANGDVQGAVDRLFSYIDEFTRLEIRSVQRAQPTAKMNAYFSGRRHMASDLVPTGYRKISLTGSLCWLIMEEPPASEFYIRDIGKPGTSETWLSGQYSIVPESWAEHYLAGKYGNNLQWTNTDESCYPQVKTAI